MDNLLESVYSTLRAFLCEALVFSPSLFFDLNESSLLPLFKDCQYVWEALGQIGAFLEAMAPVQNSPIPEGVFVKDSHGIILEEGVTIEPGAYIQGPCFVGKGSIVRHSAYIRGNVIIGRGCVFGHASEAKNSVLMDFSHAAHFAYLGDTILGKGVNLGAGTRCANLRFDGKEVVIRGERGSRFPTGRRKFGAIIGDGAQTGCNSVSNPGTLMGKGSLAFPCANFGGYIPAGTKVGGSHVF